MFLLTFKTVAAIKFIIPCMAHFVLPLANIAPDGQRGRTDLSLMALFTGLLCFSGSVCPVWGSLSLSVQFLGS